MRSERPEKTLMDYLVIAVSPALIMLLVGSLVFFLIQVFDRGEAQGSVQWVMFWFVLAVVLVARIGIEQGTTYASLYGLALAGATWLYLVRTHPAYLLGAALLAIVWWSANKLTWDCTLIDDDQDASGRGLLSIALKKETVAEPKPAEGAARPDKRSGLALRRDRERTRDASQPHAPGLWVVYFSLAALPLFGLGQVLVPREDAAARRLGFALLFVYLVAALGLLLATSFLGLRRYLRQRYLVMPPTIALGWIKSGVVVALAVLAVALLIPRPGADYTWRTLAYQLDHQLRRATEYAASRNPPGEGEGRAGEVTGWEEGPSAGGRDNEGAGAGEGSEERGPPAAGQEGPSTASSAASQPQPTAPGEGFHGLLRTLLLFAAGLWLAWWLFRHRHVIVQALRAFWQALVQFLRNLLGLGLEIKLARPATAREKPTSRPRPFAAYRNPFATGKDQVWSAGHLVAYSFEAVQAWAQEQRIESRPNQTPREMCRDLGERYPEIAANLGHLAFLYAHAAYGKSVPAVADWEPLRQLWRRLSETSAVAA